MHIFHIERYEIVIFLFILPAKITGLLVTLPRMEHENFLDEKENVALLRVLIDMASVYVFNDFRHFHTARFNALTDRTDHRMFQTPQYANCLAVLTRSALTINVIPSHDVRVAACEITQRTQFFVFGLKSNIKKKINDI